MAFDFNSLAPDTTTSTPDTFDLGQTASAVPDHTSMVSNVLNAGNNVAGAVGVQKLGQGLATAGREFTGQTGATGQQEGQALKDFTRLVGSHPMGSPERAAGLKAYLQTYEPQTLATGQAQTSDIPTQGEIDPGTKLSNREVIGSAVNTLGLVAGSGDIPGLNSEIANPNLLTRGQRILQSAETGMKGGAIIGATQGLGGGLQDTTQGAGDVIGSTLKGGIGGATTGGLIAGGVKAVGEGIGAAKSAFQSGLNDVKAANSPQALAEQAGAPKGAAEEYFNNPKSAQTAQQLEKEANPQQKVLSNIQDSLSTHSQNLSKNYTNAFQKLDSQFPNTTLKLDANGRATITDILQDYPSANARFQQALKEAGVTSLDLTKSLKPSEGFTLLKSLNGIYDDVSANPDMRSGEEKVALNAVKQFRQELINQLDGKITTKGATGPVESILNDYSKGVTTNSSLRKVFGNLGAKINDPVAQDKAVSNMMNLYAKDKDNVLNALEQIGKSTGNPNLKNQIATLHMLDNPARKATAMTTKQAATKAFTNIIKTLVSKKVALGSAGVLGSALGLKQLLK